MAALWDMYLMLASIYSRLRASRSAFLDRGSLLCLWRGFLEIDPDLPSQGRAFIEDNSPVQG